MDVKGVTLESGKKFVIDNFGEEGYNQWMSSLDSDVRDAYAESIVTKWYLMRRNYVEPRKKVCELFYGGDLKGLWDMGRSDADHGLKGIYKAFIRIATVGFVISRAKMILPMYFRPSVLKVTEKSKKDVTIRIVEFPEFDEYVELIIGGFMERTTELCRCKGVNVEIPKSVTKADPYTEYHVSWQ